MTKKTFTDKYNERVLGVESLTQDEATDLLKLGIIRNVDGNV